MVTKKKSNTEAKTLTVFYFEIRFLNECTEVSKNEDMLLSIAKKTTKSFSQTQLKSQKNIIK